MNVSMWVILPIIILLIVVFISIPKGSSHQSPPSSNSVDYGKSFDDIREERKRIAKQNYESHEKSSRSNQKRLSQLGSNPQIGYRYTPSQKSLPHPTSEYGGYNTSQLDDGNTITVYPEDILPQIKG